MVRTFLKVYMELGSYFLFLQEQIKDIIIIGRLGSEGFWVTVGDYEGGGPGRPRRTPNQPRKVIRGLARSRRP
jgi:hypothetical protein